MKKVIPAQNIPPKEAQKNFCYALRHIAAEIQKLPKEKLADKGA